MLYLKAANHSDIEKEWLFQREIPAEENSFTNVYHGISREDFYHALEKMIAHSNGLQLPDGYVPDTTYFLWSDDKIIGEFHLRHYLCESLVNGAGHIGYYIAPEYRGNGYATQGLKLALQQARKIVPEPEIYLRVDKNNPASLKVMFNNAGYIHHEDEHKYYVRIQK